MTEKSVIITVAVFFIIGIGLGLYLSQTPFMQDITPPAEPANPTFTHCPYQYLNPLRCEPDKTVKTKEYTNLRNDVQDYINEQEQNGSLTTASVYFRDLQNGPIMTINGEENFAPASLLKIPLMMTYLRKAQDDPSILQRRIPVAGDFSALPQQNIKPQQAAVIGKEYTVNDLITLMITQSDDNSWEALLNDLRKNYSEDDFIETMNDLGIIDPRKSINNNDQFVNTEQYGAIFRLLYNSSYLNIPMSNEALKLLAQSTFTNGIVAGVPPNVKTAHKFGERIAGGDEQLLDCGIVYYTPNPYIICIMTRGHDIPVLEGIIQQISQSVFNEVRSRN